jgi:cation:H+ antiporter
VPSLALAAIFIASAGVIWMAGTGLSDATDALDARLGIGSALGGLILLSIATDLPELAITISAAAGGNLGLAVGNLLGGVAIQTLVLAALDTRIRDRPISYTVGSLIVVLEASIVIALLVGAVMTAQLPASTELAGISPGTVAIVVLWFGGLYVVDRTRKSIPWRAEAPGARPGRSKLDRAKGHEANRLQDRPTAFVTGVFVAAAVATLLAGVAIEESGNELAGRMGLSGAVFGATILAASTALPELSTGIASVKLGDNELAFSDIFGGNAFLPVLFVVADAVAGEPALSHAQATDIWMAGLGIMLTAVYIAGLIVRPKRKLGLLGPDSLAAIVIYVLGIVGLVVIG